MKVQFCKVWTALQSYLTLASFMSIHGTHISSGRHITVSENIIIAVVAIRVYALHAGRSWVRYLLWFGGILYFLTSTTLVTLGAIPVVCELSTTSSRKYTLTPFTANLRPFHHACVGPVSGFLHGMNERHG